MLFRNYYAFVFNLKQTLGFKRFSSAGDLEIELLIAALRSRQLAYRETVYRISGSSLATRFGASGSAGLRIDAALQSKRCGTDLNTAGSGDIVA